MTPAAVSLGRAAIVRLGARVGVLQGLLLLLPLGSLLGQLCIGDAGLLLKRVRSVVSQLRPKLWVQQLLGARRARHVGALLRRGLALVRIVASLQAFLALHTGRSRLAGAAASTAGIHLFRLWYLTECWAPG